MLRHIPDHAPSSRPNKEASPMSDPNTQLQTVNMSVSDGVATVQLNRPAGAERLEQAVRRRPARGPARGAPRRVRARGADRRRRTGVLLGRGPEGLQRRRDDAGRAPGRLQDADRALPPDHGRDPRDAQARDRVRARPGGRHRLLAGAVLRLDPRRAERLLPARVRQHRPRPRRRLLAVRAHARRHGPRERAGDARRAPGSPTGARSGA